MDTAQRQDILRAIRQRAEADRILGATAWPVARSVLRRGGHSAGPIPQPPAASSGPHRPPETASAVSQEGAAPPLSMTNATQPIDPAEITERQRVLDVLNASQVRTCKKCGLCSTRTQTVFGQGSAHPRIVFVGEAPGFDEDRTGLAFVGRAGQLLTAMIERGMGIRRDDVFICNVLKCRPPENRTPAADEIAACSPYLFEQLRTLRPEVIVALGAPAAQTLLQTTESIGRLRGRFHDFYLSGAPLGNEAPVPLMPTYHPAYLLRSPSEKVKAWEDLKHVLRRLNLPVPGAV